MALNWLPNYSERKVGHLRMARLDYPLDVQAHLGHSLPLSWRKRRVTKWLKYSLVSLLFGWWGIPWGPIYTIGSFITNFKGSKDVTQQVLASLQKAVAQ